MQIKSLQFNMLPVNTYVLWDGTGEAAVIDPGCYYKGEDEKLCSFIRDNRLVLKHLLNTHLHFDHVFGNPAIEEAFGIYAEGNGKDNSWITELPEKLGAFGMKFERAVAPIREENFLKEGDTIHFGNTELTVLEVPGHSPGSLAFYCKEDGVLFTGDAIFRGSIGRTDFVDGNHSDLIRSIREKIMTLPADTVLYPGHGPTTTVAHELEQNPYI